MKLSTTPPRLTSRSMALDRAFSSLFVDIVLFVYRGRLSTSASYCTLNTWKMVSLDRSYTTFYYSAIVSKKKSPVPFSRYLTFENTVTVTSNLGDHSSCEFMHDL